MAIIAKITTFHCDDCKNSFEAVYRYSKPDEVHPCNRCQSSNTLLKTHEVDTSCKIELMGISDWDSTEYNPGLGCITRNKKHREQIAKERGLYEVGNENVERISELQDRKLEHKLEALTEKSFEEGTYHMYEAVKKARSR